MAKIKYSEDQEPLTKKHYGYTFIKNSVNYSMFPGQRNKRTRKTYQLEKMQNLQKAVRFWRTMPGSVKEIWETFAATYPQPSKRITGIPLTGYQLFIKRNHYCFLNAGLLSDFMEQPELVSLPSGTVVFTLQAGLNSIDLTEIYIKNFGFIPSPGQWLIFAAVPYSEISGQFFPVIYQSIQVLETYIDGFFLNIEMPTIQPNIVYSVYLSKPVNPGQNHKSSKVRYMGCFTTKSFLGLSDTPESYAGQAGKVVMVNEDENALEFGPNGGGGLTCEDLPDCPTIIDLQNSVNQIANFLVVQNDITIPAVKYGLLYNGYAAKSSLIPSASEWHCLTYNEWVALQTYLTSIAKTGNDLKETGTVYWSSDIGLNTCKFFARGSGYLSIDGTFNPLRQNNYFWAADYPLNPARMYSFYVTYNTGSFSMISASTQWNRGYSLRLCRPAPGIADFTVGSYIGNNNIVYRTTHLNGIEYLAENLSETKFSDGSDIPYFEATAGFIASTTPACIAPFLSWANVMI